jgi:hypothetical protein
VAILLDPQLVLASCDRHGVTKHTGAFTDGRSGTEPCTRNLEAPSVRKFFYASAAILMLAIAYHLGASTATAQAAGTLADVHDTGLGSYAVTPSGAVYFSFYGSLSAPAPHWSPRGNISSPSPIMHIGDAQLDGSQVVVHAFAENGNFYVSTDDGRTWSLHGNVFGGPVPALQQSWGQLKKLYAPKSGTAFRAPTNR